MSDRHWKQIAALCSAEVLLMAYLGTPRWLLAIALTFWVLGMIVWIPSSKRVLVAWTSYVACRCSSTFKSPSAKRWLWIKTLRTANGTDSLPPEAP